MCPWNPSNATTQFVVVKPLHIFFLFAVTLLSSSSIRTHTGRMDEWLPVGFGFTEWEPSALISNKRISNASHSLRSAATLRWWRTMRSAVLFHGGINGSAGSTHCSLKAAQDNNALMPSAIWIFPAFWADRFSTHFFFLCTAQISNLAENFSPDSWLPSIRWWGAFCTLSLRW